MDEFDGVKVGEIYTWKMSNTKLSTMNIWICVDISKARPYGKTGKMFSNITYLWNGKLFKTRHIDGSNKGRWITLNEML